MIDFINSLDRKQLISFAKKIKIEGYLNNFETPLIEDNKLRELTITYLSDNNIKKKKKKQHGSPKRRNGKPIKKFSKKQNDYSSIKDIKILDDRSYIPLPEGAKLVAIGDLHGDLCVTIKTLKLARVIPLSTPNCPENLNDIDWIGGNTHVVQVGDQIDRCRPNSWYREIGNDNNTYQDEGSGIKIMTFLDNLHLKALKKGGALISILGNHEIMNCVGDFRYVSPKEFEECGEYFCAKKTQHKRIFPYGYKERKLAFCPGGIIAKRFASMRKSIVQVGDWVFVHGGITPKLAEKYTLDEMNFGMRKWLVGCKDKFTKNIFNDLYEDDEHGIFWTREFGDLENWDEGRSNKLFIKTIDLLNMKNNRNISKGNLVKGLIVGHTPQYMNNKGINSSCGGRIWRVDVGASKAFGPFAKSDENKFRKNSILMIQNNKCKVLREK